MLRSDGGGEKGKRLKAKLRFSGAKSRECGMKGGSFKTEGKGERET